RGHKFRRDAARAAVGHLLLGAPARSGSAEALLRQPDLLCDLGVPRRVSRPRRLAIVDRRRRIARTEPGAVGRLLLGPEERRKDQELARPAAPQNGSVALSRAVRSLHWSPRRARYLALRIARPTAISTPPSILAARPLNP